MSAVPMDGESCEIVQKIMENLDKTLTPEERKAPTFLEWSDQTIIRCVRSLSADLHDQIGFKGILSTGLALALVKFAKENQLYSYTVRLGVDATVEVTWNKNEQALSDQST